jgi:hypothetical protein
MEHVAAQLAMERRRREKGFWRRLVRAADPDCDKAEIMWMAQYMGPEYEDEMGNWGGGGGEYPDEMIMFVLELALRADPDVRSIRLYEKWIPDVGYECEPPC